MASFIVQRLIERMLGRLRAFASRGNVAAMRHALLSGRALLTRLPPIAAATALAANFSVSPSLSFSLSFCHPVTSTNCVYNILLADDARTHSGGQACHNQRCHRYLPEWAAVCGECSLILDVLLTLCSGLSKHVRQIRSAFLLT